MSETTPETVQPVQPTVITLDNANSIQILSQYVEIAQSKGAFLLPEAELLKRAVDVLKNNVPDNEINNINGRQLLIQGIHKGQRHGSYTLNDAALLSKVVQFVEMYIQSLVAPPQTSNQEVETQQPETQQPETNNEQQEQQETHIESDDLSDLAEPVPLKPKEV